MRVLLIDNFDSFTFNLVDLVEKACGHTPTVIANNAPGWGIEDIEAFDAVIISPGPGSPHNPADMGMCLEVIAQARIPILGVCLGHQALAVAHGGSVGRAPRAMHGIVDQVQVSPAELVRDKTSLFSGLPAQFPVMRYHSLCVTQLPPNAQVLAQTADGVVQALAFSSHPHWGVQFHPESIGSERGCELMTNFLSLAAQWNRAHRLRVHTEAIEFSPGQLPDGAVLFQELFAGCDASFWLDSTDPTRAEGRWSFLGNAQGPLAEVWTDTAGSVFEDLHADLSRLHLKATASGALTCPHVPFQLGWVGWLGYELKAETGGQAAHQSPHPDVGMIFADRALAIDHQKHTVYVLSLLGTEHDAQQLHWSAVTAARVRALSGCSNPPLPARLPQVEQVGLRHSKKRYLELIEQVHERILDGHTYEVCLSNQLHARDTVDGWQAYLALRAANPTPFGAYLQIGGIEVLSSSPERFLHVSASGVAESRPIKGTRRVIPAHVPGAREANAALAEDLASNQKDRAENLMIVDLVRNDLTQVAVPGTVEVTELCEVETFATVHQLVSTIRAQLRPERSAVQALRACFPGGSMTGAPKKRTMEIIDELEGSARGIYSGGIGYFSLDGAADISMVIRTIVLFEQGLSYGVGGAIIALSDPEAEFAETVTKAAPLLNLLGQELGHSTELE